MSHHRYNVGAMQLLQMRDGQGCSGWTNWPSKQYAPWAQDCATRCSRQTRAAAGVLSKLRCGLRMTEAQKPTQPRQRLSGEIFDRQPKWMTSNH